MPESNRINSTGGGVIGAGSAALRRAITNPLFRKAKANELDGPSRSASNDSINSIIEGEIIPRLLMAHASGEANTDRDRGNGATSISPSAATRFAQLPLHLEVTGLMDEVEAFFDEGVSVESVYLDLLAPSARRLGEMWESDECDFIDVTMGLWRLQEVMREISARIPMHPGTVGASASRSLFASVPGDEHSFGALMLDDFFARAGWNSTVISQPLRKELLDRVSKEPFDIVGLTLSRDCPSAAVTNIIKAMRSVSCNPHLSILIGGHMINQNPAIVAEVGADGTGADARAALEVANALVQSAKVRAHLML